MSPRAADLSFILFQPCGPSCKREKENILWSKHNANFRRMSHLRHAPTVHREAVDTSADAFAQVVTKLEMCPSSTEVALDPLRFGI